MDGISHDPPEIILIWWFAAQETCIIYSKLKTAVLIIMLQVQKNSNGNLFQIKHYKCLYGHFWSIYASLLTPNVWPVVWEDERKREQGCETSQTRLKPWTMGQETALQQYNDLLETLQITFHFHISRGYLNLKAFECIPVF